MKILFIIALVVVFMTSNSCGHSCREWAEVFRKENLQFKVYQKYRRGRDIVIEGSNSEKDVFQWGGWKELYESCHVGDSLVKVKGKTQVLLFKKDTTMIFPYKCQGEVIE